MHIKQIHLTNNANGYCVQAKWGGIFEEKPCTSVGIEQKDFSYFL